MIVKGKVGDENWPDLRTEHPWDAKNVDSFIKKTMRR